MFIKVIKSGSNESVYQCKRYHVTRWDFKMIKLDLEDNDGTGVSLEYDCSVPGKLAIFAMNNEGQTIDTLCKNY